MHVATDSIWVDAGFSSKPVQISSRGDNVVRDGQKKRMFAEILKLEVK